MNKKTAINKVIFGVLLAFAMPFMVLGASPTVDNSNSVTIEQLQGQIIKLLLIQLHMLEKQLADLQKTTIVPVTAPVEEIAPVVEPKAIPAVKQPIQPKVPPVYHFPGTAQA